MDAIKSLVPLTDDQAVIRPCRLLLTSLIGELRNLLTSIELFEQRIKTLTRSMTGYKLFKSLPGTGEINAARLMAALGTNKNKYVNATEMLFHVGVAPLPNDQENHALSAGAYNVRPPSDRRSLSGRSSTWAKAYYHMQIEQGKPHNAAVRALAYKWERILFRCWQENTINDEAKYITMLAEKMSPIIGYLA